MPDRCCAGGHAIFDTIERSPSTITFIDRFPVLQRVALFLFGLLPLAAPYELLLRTYWKDGSLQFAAIPLLLSLGSLAFSILFIVSALFGAEKQITFDRGLRTIIHRSRPGLAGLREQRYPFGTVERVEIRTHAWSDGRLHRKARGRTRSRRGSGGAR